MRVHIEQLKLDVASREEREYMNWNTAKRALLIIMGANKRIYSLEPKVYCLLHSERGTLSFSDEECGHNPIVSFLDFD